MLEAGQDDPEALKQLQSMFEDEEAKSVFSRNKLANPLHILNPKTVSAASYADKLATGEGQLFSEETAQAMNDYFSPEVNRMPGRKTRIAGVYPGQNPEAMVFDLGVTPTDGLKGVEQPEYNSPMTINRGIAGEDDEIMEVPIEEMIKRVQGARMIYQDLGPERLQRAQASLRAMGYLPKEEAKWEQVQGPGGSILQRNTATGELKNVLGRAPQAAGSGGGSYGNPTSQQKNFLFLRDALNLSDEDAYKVAFGGTGAVNDRVSDRVMKGISLLNTQIKEIDSTINTQGMMLEEEELAQLNAARQELAQQRDMLASRANLFGDDQGLPQLGQSQAQQQQQPQQSPIPYEEVSEMADSILDSILKGEPVNAQGSEPKKKQPKKPKEKPKASKKEPELFTDEWFQQRQASVEAEERRLQGLREKGKEYQPVTRRGLQEPEEDAPRRQGMGLSPSLIQQLPR